MRRIAVVGSSGSGKTTFARRLATPLGVRHIELDAFHWGPGWTEVDNDSFRRGVAEALEAEGWVTDGNYSKVRDLYLARVDTVVWLDLPLRTCVWRILRRTARRARTGEELWGTGNRESWRNQLTRDSLVWWLITTHRRRRRENEARFRDRGLAHIAVFRFRSSAEAD